MSKPPFFTQEQVEAMITVYEKMRKEVIESENFSKFKPVVIHYIESIDGLLCMLKEQNPKDLSTTEIAGITEYINVVGYAVIIHGYMNVTLRQILQDKNLDYHLKQLDTAIVEIDKKIAVYQSAGKSVDSLKIALDDLIILKDRIRVS